MDTITFPFSSNESATAKEAGRQLKSLLLYLQPHGMSLLTLLTANIHGALTRFSILKINIILLNSLETIPKRM